MKMIGTIIAHSGIQGGPGFPLFSPAVYAYFSTGSVDAAVQYLDIDDCANLNYREVILKVCNRLHCTF